MESPAQPVNDDAARRHLQHIRELSQWIAAAMRSIAANNLHELRENVAQQEVLAQAIICLGYCRKVEKTSALEPEIASAMHRLYRMNLQYSALLRHSGETLQMLMTLNRSLRGDIRGGMERASKRQTWACEV